MLPKLIGCRCMALAERKAFGLKFSTKVVTDLSGGSVPALVDTASVPALEPISLHLLNLIFKMAAELID